MKAWTLLLTVLCATPAFAQKPAAATLARWQREAARVTIIRDDWGIAHVYGHTDADAVFGMIYAQAEDDFNRVEMNYLTSLGRMSEAEGENALYSDLRQRLFINDDTLKHLYARSPQWIHALMDGWADGLNYFLYKHPDVRPRVLTHFEPWMALSFSEGSIGGDIERISPGQLQAFYTGHPELHTAQATPEFFKEPGGSNGIAIAPKNTQDHHALLYINPHTSFFFRSELQMVSDEGLDAYGAVTWGQFFIYQGFNPHAGWMHTSSGVDNIDEFLETVTKQGDRYVYRHGTQQLPVTTSQVTIAYKSGDSLAHRTFTTFHTMHGPVVRELNGKWVTTSLMNDPLNALMQSYGRTKAKDYASFKKWMDYHTNSSNNTIFADGSGNIAYFHSNYIPRRDTSFDWTKPVDGSDPRTDYHGVLAVDESPNLVNPAGGWLYNSNNWPWSAAGPDSPKRSDYPKYVETGTAESARGEHALIVLPNKHDFTMQSLIDAGFDSYLPFFADHLPALIAAYDALPASDSLKSKLADQIGVLRGWNYRWAANSVPTSLAVFWGTALMRSGMRELTASKMLEALSAASDRLTSDFGTWRTAWGEINRFQRLTGDIVQPFNDAAPSIPVPFTSSIWGSLASFGARPYPDTKRWYGTSGNSFVAVVEFGDSVRARAITAGGESGHPGNPHFNDEAERYASGNLRTVYFYRSQLEGHTERTYRP